MYGHHPYLYLLGKTDVTVLTLLTRKLGQLVTFNIHLNSYIYTHKATSISMHYTLPGVKDTKYIQGQNNDI